MKLEAIDETNLVHALRQALPELEQAYQDTITNWSSSTTPGNYILIAETLVPRLLEELQKDQISDFLMRCGLFLERVCACGNDEAINVIWIRVFECLISNEHKRDLERLWPILGPETKRMIRDAARRWSDAARMFGHEKDLPEENIPD